MHIASIKSLVMREDRVGESAVVHMLLDAEVVDSEAEMGLNRDDLAPSMELATQVVKVGIHGLVFPSVVEGGGENLVVYTANCSAISLEIHNKREFLEEAEKIAKRHT